MSFTESLGGKTQKNMYVEYLWLELYSPVDMIKGIIVVDSTLICYERSILNIKEMQSWPAE